MSERGLARRGLATATPERSCFEVPDSAASVNETGLREQGKKGLEFGNQAHGP